MMKKERVKGIKEGLKKIREFERWIKRDEGMRSEEERKVIEKGYEEIGERMNGREEIGKEEEEIEGSMRREERKMI